MINKHLLRLLVLLTALLSTSAILLRPPLANHLLQKGIELKKNWKLEQAVRHFEWSLHLRDSAEARIEKAVTHRLRGEFLRSQTAIDSLLKKNLAATQPLLWNTKGSNHFHRNEPEAAIGAHKKSLELAKKNGDRRQEAEALIGWGRVLYHHQGQADEAVELLERALRTADDLSEKRIAANALRHLGAIFLWHKGEIDRPLKEYFLPALRLYEEAGDLRGASITLSNIGLAYSVDGDHFQALNYLNRSIDLKRQIGFLSGLCDSYSQIGTLYTGVNKKKALYYYRQALELSKKIGYRLTENEVENHLANVYFAAGELGQAELLVNDLIERDKKNPMIVKYRLGALARIQLAAGNPSGALEVTNRSLELNQAAHDSRFKAGALLFSARVQLQLSDYETARQRLAETKELMSNQAEKYWPEEVDLRVLLSKLMEQDGNRPEATRYLLEAVNIESHAFESSRTHLVQGQHPELYNRLFPLLLNNDADAETAFSVLEQVRYRTFRNLIVRASSNLHGSRQRDKEEAVLSRIERISETLRRNNKLRLRKELKSAYFEYEDLILKAELDQAHRSLIEGARPITFQEIHDILDPHIAIVQYVIAGERVYCLLARRGKLLSFLLPVSAKNLEAKVKLFRSLIFDNAHSNDWLPVARDLRSVLISLLESSDNLEGIRFLALIPSGSLHHLPFSALARMEDGTARYLSEDYTTFRIPSATYLYQKLHASDREAGPAGRVISFGRNHSDESDFRQLRFAEEEARAVARLFQGELRTDRSATETELKRNAPKFKYIHIASHAVSEPQMPLLSRIKLQKTKEDDGNLTIPEILNLPLQANLVTLGACRTAQSFSHGGNEQNDFDRTGLMESFLFAGADSVVATLFPIDDLATIHFMKDFYQNLSDSSKAEALSRTQIKMIRNKAANDFSHPRYWAPFVLVGDFR